MVQEVFFICFCLTYRIPVRQILTSYSSLLIINEKVLNTVREAIEMLEKMKADLQG